MWATIEKLRIWSRGVRVEFVLMSRAIAGASHAAKREFG
jgi:hypothetical protein